MKKLLTATFVLLLLLSGSFTQKASAIVYNNLEVQYRTQDEIRQFIMEHPACINDPVEFSEFPILSSPQFSGQLSLGTLNSAINMTNIQRYIAGLTYNTYLHEPYNRYAQDGSFVTHFNGSLSHYPTKPASVDQAIFDSGYIGTSRSNLGLGYYNINSTIVNGYMEDGDPSNIDRVGHRRWILNEFANRFGFGHLSKSNAMYVVDGYPSTSEFTKGIAFPAQNQPLEYFDEYFPWSIAANIDLNAVTHDVRVVLKRLNDGKIWTFSSSQSDGYFNVNNTNYGYSIGYIIFRPNLQNYEIKSGDKYQVTVTSTLVNFQYNVDFFSLNITPNCKYNSESVSTKPLISNVVSNNSSITFGWNSITNASVYNIYRSDTLSGPMVLVGNTNQRTFTDIGIIPNKTYYYFVRAYDSLYNNGVLSDAKSISAQVAQPTNVNISSTFLKSNIQWTSSSVVDGYEIYRSATQDTGFVKIGQTSLTQYSDVNINAGSTNYYRIRSYVTINGIKYYSTFSTSQIATAVSPKPEVISAQQSDHDAIKIIWSAVEDSTGYKVELYNPTTLKYQTIGTTNKLTYTQSGLAFNKSYTFRVTPYLTLSNSTIYGNAASVVVSIPEKPISAISIEKLPLKTSYLVGESLNLNRCCHESKFQRFHLFNVYDFIRNDQWI
jgi:fibronectin type 3 domain-containing protein